MILVPHFVFIKNFDEGNFVEQMQRGRLTHSIAWRIRDELSSETRIGLLNRQMHDASTAKEMPIMMKKLMLALILA